jgi:glycosyltransferase involved in cell wall biosynthesis
VYSREILHGLSRRHPEEQFLFCYRTQRMWPSLGDSLPGNARRALLRTVGIAPWRCGIFHALNQRVDSRFAPTVATFHDLFVMSGAYSTPEFRARFKQQARDATERADLIIAVSAFTAGQVSDLLGVDRGRIRVVHHGVRAPASAPPPDSDRENLIVHVGAIQERKNIGRLVEAFERLPAGWRLALAGATNGYGAAEILQRIERSPRRSNIDLLGYTSDAGLERLYSRARVVAFPSLDEGFGMPVLDAMARGIPVLTSTRSALPEIAGNAALLVNPLDSDEIADGLSTLVGSSELRQDLRNRGLARAAKFKWEESVDSTWSVYRELVGSALPG